MIQYRPVATCTSVYYKIGHPYFLWDIVGQYILYIRRSVLGQSGLCYSLVIFAKSSSSVRNAPQW